MNFWSDQIVALASEKNIQLYDLKNTNARRDKFESYLRGQSPTFIFINGHGSPYELCGHDNEVLVDKDSSLNTNIVYARSCDAGAVLGNSLVADGAKAFIGYTRKYTLCFMPEHNTRPMTDPIAKYFLEPSNLIASTIIKGHSASDADSRSKDEMFKNVRKMLSSDSSDTEKYAARFLWANMRCQILLGDGTAKA